MSSSAIRNDPLSFLAAVKTREHQFFHLKRMLEILQKSPLAFDLTPMGMGKTFVAAAVVEAWQYENVIVVCPASLEWHWRNTLQGVDIKDGGGGLDISSSCKGIIKNLTILSYDALRGSSGKEKTTTTAASSKKKKQSRAQQKTSEAASSEREEENETTTTTSSSSSSASTSLSADEISTSLSSEPGLASPFRIKHPFLTCKAAAAEKAAATQRNSRSDKRQKKVRKVSGGGGGASLSDEQQPSYSKTCSLVYESTEYFANLCQGRTLLIFDEIHFAKNASTHTHAAVAAMIREVKKAHEAPSRPDSIARALLLTGTLFDSPVHAINFMALIGVLVSSKLVEYDRMLGMNRPVGLAELLMHCTSKIDGFAESESMVENHSYRNKIFSIRSRQQAESVAYDIIVKVILPTLSSSMNFAPERFESKKKKEEIKTATTTKATEEEEGAEKVTTAGDLVLQDDLMQSGAGGPGGNVDIRLDCKNLFIRLEETKEVEWRAILEKISDTMMSSSSSPSIEEESKYQQEKEFFEEEDVLVNDDDGTAKGRKEAKNVRVRLRTPTGVETLAVPPEAVATGRSLSSYLALHYEKAAVSLFVGMPLTPIGPDTVPDVASVITVNFAEQHSVLRRSESEACFALLADGKKSLWDDRAEMAASVLAGGKKVEQLRSGKGTSWIALTEMLMKMEVLKIQKICALAHATLQKDPSCKVVIAMNYLCTIDRIFQELSKLYPGEQVRMITGKSSSKKQRSEIVNQFQANSNETRVLVCSLRVVSFGISLDDQSGGHKRVVFASPSYHAIDQHQFLRRFYRSNTKSTPKIRIVYGAGTVVVPSSSASAGSRGDALREDRLISALAKKAAVLREASPAFIASHLMYNDDLLSEHDE